MSATSLPLHFWRVVRSSMVMSRFNSLWTMHHQRVSSLITKERKFLNLLSMENKWWAEIHSTTTESTSLKIFFIKVIMRFILDSNQAMSEIVKVLIISRIKKIKKNMFTPNLRQQMPTLSFLALINQVSKLLTPSFVWCQKIGLLYQLLIRWNRQTIARG